MGAIGAIGSAWRFQALAFWRRELTAHFAQPVAEADDLRQLEVMRRSDEVIRVALAHALTRGPHQAARGQVAGDQRPAREREPVTLLGCGQHGDDDEAGEDEAEVGAETETNSGLPKQTVFCTISMLHRLVTATNPSSGSRPARSTAPINLSNAL